MSSKLKPNILFIVLDSFPANKCFGKDKSSITPNIDYLIKNGVCFSQAISSADGTAFSLGSIFTALYPFKTGMGGEYYHKLNLKVETYIKILKKYGYTTYGFVPKITNLFGLTDDFNNVITYSAVSRLHNGLGNQIIRELESKNLTQPWFYYIHLLDSHIPTLLEREFDNEKYGETKYDRTISMIDVWIGRILNIIDKKNTLIIFTADHGDFVPSIEINGKKINFENVSFNSLLDNIAKRWPTILNPIRSRLVNSEQNFRKKRKLNKIKNFALTLHQKRKLLYTRADPNPYLYDEVIHIPLIFSGLSVPTNKIISQQVRSIDIFPTIVDIIGIDNNNKTIDGRSLLPFFDGKKLEDLPAYIESAGLVKKSENDVIGVRTSEFKYFRSIMSPTKKVTLYDLSNDPNEENNIANSKPNVVEKMEQTLTKIRQEYLSNSINDELSKEQTAEIENELRKLGYIQ